MTIALLNTFCRKFDLIFIEMGRMRGDDVYWFLSDKQRRCYYTAEEIESKVES